MVGEQLALRHLIAPLDLERLQRARGLSANINICNGLHDARRHYRTLYIAPLHRRGGIDYLSFAEDPVIPQRACAGDQECAN